MILLENTMRWRQARESEFLSRGPASLGELLTRAADCFGASIAIDFFERDQTLSFVDWHHKTNQLANGLRELGVEAGTKVGLVLSNRVEFPITWMALARLGAVMVPINPAYTEREFQHVVSTVGIRLLVCEDAVAATVSGVNALSSENLILVSNDGAESTSADWTTVLERQSAIFEPIQPVKQTDLAVIQFTSGTTGFPKGCMQSHLYWLICAFNSQLPEGSVFSTGSALSAAPFFYFDALWMMVRTLTSGATLFVAERYSIKKQFQQLVDTQAELAMSPVLSDDYDPRERAHNVKLFITVAASAEESEETERRCGALAREVFGMSEIGLALSVPINTDDDEIRGSCGFPNPFYEVKVVDEDGTEQPTNVPGELWVRGMGVIHGYWSDDAANDRSFSDGWFKTGDIFRKTPNGYFVFVGRIKDMIKRSGENISAAEVESVVKEFPAIAAVGVIPVPHKLRGEEVKAVIQLRKGLPRESFNYSAFREHCRLNLAGFKIPRYVEIVDEIELTPSGKIAKAQLTSKRDLTSGCWDLKNDKAVAA